MTTIKHETKTHCPTVVVRLDAEQMLYRTDKDGFYIYAEAQFAKEQTIEGLRELLKIEIEAEGVDDGIVLIRVWAVEYTVEGSSVDFDNNIDILYTPDNWDANENDGVEGVTGKHILDVCGGDYALADRVYALCDWQHPATVLDELKREESAWYVNKYRCPCGAEWHDEHDCMCNDRCPKCNKEIEPYESEEV